MGGSSTPISAFRCFSSLAVVAGIAGTALVTSREQEGNIKKTENNIWLDFFHFDQRSFPFSSGIHGGVLDHVELEFWKNINPHCLQAPKGDPPPHLLDLGPLGSHISGQSWPRELQVVPFNSARRAESNETHFGFVRSLLVKRFFSLLFLNLQRRAIHAGTFLAVPSHSDAVGSIRDQFWNPLDKSFQMSYRGVNSINIWPNETPNKAYFSSNLRWKCQKCDFDTSS